MIANTTIFSKPRRLYFKFRMNSYDGINYAFPKQSTIKSYELEMEKLTVFRFICKCNDKS